MATKKATASKSTASRKAAAKTTVKKTATKVVSAPAKAAKPVAATELRLSQKTGVFPDNLPNIILAEILGTFILTGVALVSFAVSPYAASHSSMVSNLLIDPLFIGLALTVLALGLGSISGAHVNPAVTFGLWSAKKLKLALVPIYWVSQFIGALVAIAIAYIMSRGAFTVGFGSFTQFDLPLMFIELIGTAVFLFGIMSVVSRNDASTGAKALGIGMSLTIALVVGTSLLAVTQGAAAKKYESAIETAQVASMDDLKKVSAERPLYVNGPVLNPAVALVAGESGTTVNVVASNKVGSQRTLDVAEVANRSRFGLEVIVGSLVGAALGANLFRVVNSRPKKVEA